MTRQELWDWLVLNQKYIWAGLYLAAIPGFGVAYSYMDRAFYAPNLRLEQSYSEDARKVAGDICQLYNNRDKYFPARIETRVSRFAMSDEVRRMYAAELEKIAANTFNCDTPVTVSSGKMRALSVDASARNTNWQDRHQNQRFEVRMFESRAAILILYDVSFFTSPFAFTRPSVSDVRDTTPGAKPVEREVAHLIFGEAAHLFFGGFFEGSMGSEEEALLARLWRFTEGDTGFTSDVSDNLQRMIYFSAVTITTLGFGDIVPITTWARWLVTSEAVFGVVLIGLFLNSLTR